MAKYNEEKQKKQREEDKKEDGGWKGWKNGNDVKDGNEVDLERSNISVTVLCE